MEWIHSSWFCLPVWCFLFLNPACLCPFPSSPCLGWSRPTGCSGCCSCCGRSGCVHAAFAVSVWARGEETTYLRPGDGGLSGWLQRIRKLLVIVPAEKHHRMSQIRSSHFAYNSSISLFRLFWTLPWIHSTFCFWSDALISKVLLWVLTQNIQRFPSLSETGWHRNRKQADDSVLIHVVGSQVRCLLFPRPPPPHSSCPAWLRLVCLWGPRWHSTRWTRALAQTSARSSSCVRVPSSTCSPAEWGGAGLQERIKDGETDKVRTGAHPLEDVVVHLQEDLV